MTAQTLTLTDFLLARIAEDEAVLREPQYANLAEPIDLRQLLAECEAKRRIINTRPAMSFDTSEERQAWRLKDHVLRLLALPYADHPDYRAANWTPWSDR